MITRDRCASAVRSIGKLKALAERPPIIVVDNGSTDDTVRTVRQMAGVHVIAAGANLGAAGRNLGVKQADTPYIAFADDDSWWADGALTTAARLLDQHPGLALLAAATLVGPAEVPDPLNDVFAAAPLGRAAGMPGPSLLGFLACASVVRRTAFLQAGGFHSRYGVGGEEQLLAFDLAAAGWESAYVPEMVAHHHPAQTDNRSGRQARQVRNDLWTCWLRRRPAAAVGHTVDVLRTATHNPAVRQGVVSAIAGLPWVLRERKALPPAVERMAQRLDDAPPSGGF